MRWDDIASERGYRMMRAYGQAKALMIMTTNELARRLEGSGVTANSVHPGVVRTGIIRKSGNRILGALFDLVAPLVLMSPERAASHVLRLAISGRGCRRQRDLLEQEPHRGACRGGGRPRGPGARLEAERAACGDERGGLTSPRSRGGRSTPRRLA